jgi:hypothetical protein
MYDNAMFCYYYDHGVATSDQITFEVTMNVEWIPLNDDSFLGQPQSIASSPEVLDIYRERAGFNNGFNSGVKHDDKPESGSDGIGSIIKDVVSVGKEIWQTVKSVGSFVAPLLSLFGSIKDPKRRHQLVLEVKLRHYIACKRGLVEFSPLYPDEKTSAAAHPCSSGKRYAYLHPSEETILARMDEYKSLAAFIYALDATLKSRESRDVDHASEIVIVQTSQQGPGPRDSGFADLPSSAPPGMRSPVYDPKRP